MASTHNYKKLTITCHQFSPYSDNRRSLLKLWDDQILMSANNSDSKFHRAHGFRNLKNSPPPTTPPPPQSTAHSQSPQLSTGLSQIGRQNHPGERHHTNIPWNQTEFPSYGGARCATT
ncbi:hypothetical protein KC19_4G055400 [Ceratodon purpureus]|uniref:Uncharacterized protein n=1 Tax=Ceratodon purpureus TaxID=3225 RepID=A0A8T0I739_CERPU|nr:hypothetical protein KC19_4G055400 [Ceratodon purpureus]